MLGRFEFGFGLSYTTFNMSDLSVSTAVNTSLTQYPGNNSVQPGGNPELFAQLATVSVTVSNTGDVYGAAVPQLYVSIVSSCYPNTVLTSPQLSMPMESVPENTPMKVLRGFEKVPLDAGASQTVVFPLTRRDLSYWDINAQAWALPANGSFTVQVGSSSRDLPLSSTLSMMVAS